MKKITTKTISLVLSLMMILSLVQMSVFAEDYTSVNENVTIEMPDNEYGALSVGDTLLYAGSWSDEEVGTLDGVTYDYDTNTLTLCNVTTNYLDIAEMGDITVNFIGENNFDQIDLRASNVILNNSGIVTVTGWLFDLGCKITFKGGFWNLNRGFSSENGQLNIESGRIYSECISLSAFSAVGSYADNYCSFTMSGGNLEITGDDYGVFVRRGDIEFLGGTVKISAAECAVMSDGGSLRLGDNMEILENGLNVVQLIEGETEDSGTYVIGSEGAAFDENGAFNYAVAKSVTIREKIIENITVQKSSDGNWYSYQDGIKVDYTGFADNEYGTWYVENGQVTFNKNDVIKDDRDGTWKYVNGSKFTVTDTVAKNSNGWWRVEDGIVNFSAEGVYKNEYGWWYCKNGQVQFGYTGIQKNDLGWWRIVGGKVDFFATGVYQNELGWWYCKDGKVQFNYTGIKNNANGWWRIENGKVNFSANGVYQNELGWWKVENGKVNFNFTGIAANSNGKWYCKNGKVDFSKNGKVTYGGTTYTVKGGKVV